MSSKKAFAAKIRRLEAIADCDSELFQTQYLLTVFQMKFRKGSAEAQLVSGMLKDDFDADFLSESYKSLNVEEFSAKFFSVRRKIAEATAHREKLKQEKEHEAREERKRQEAGRAATIAQIRKEEEQERIAEEKKREERERQRLVKLEEERKQLEELEKRRAPIKKSIWRGLNTLYMETLSNLDVLDSEALCDRDEIVLSWLRQYFDSKGDSQVSDEQLLAIGNCDNAVLLRARAGSGKTTVIKHKVDFKIRHLGFEPSQIMVLAFNKIAADQVKRDLQTDFNHLTFSNARTFHSLAYRIVQPTQDLLFDIDSGSNAKQSQFVESLLEKESNPRFRKDLYQFFRAELKQMANIGSFLTKEDYYTFRRNAAQDTLGGDPVKSIGEKWIADFLFEHDIRYMYERAWYRDKTGEQGNYHPDFSLAVNSKIPDVVIEHWGIDETDLSQSVPEHWNKTWSEYRDEMDLKREYWRNHNQKDPNRSVTFLETSICDTQDGREAFEKHLKQLLSNIGVICTKIPEEVLIEKVIRKYIARFSRMCLQFIQRAKKQCLTPEDLDKEITHFNFSCEKEKVFCLIANRIYHRYANELEESNLIDFDDLMALAVDRIKRERGNVVIDPTLDSALNLNTLKWLMVDEFQDFSPLFFNLVKALRSHNPSLRLFCVGDDWQAINGFAGSDLTYFNDFGHHFTDATLLDLQNNYRSQPNIVAQGNAFMVKTNGAPSIPMASLPSEPIRLVYTNTVFIEQRPNVLLEDNPDKIFMTQQMSRGELKNIDINGKTARLFKTCYSIMSKYPLESTKFMILNRNNYLGFSYETMPKFKTKLKSCFSRNEQQSFRSFDAQVDCLTAHSSKGEEADIVIILNALDRRFPIIHSDNELYRLLGVSVDKVYAEEERLFYVAITRAKQALFIVTEVERESEFLERIAYKELKLSNPSVPADAVSSSPEAPTSFDDEIPF